MCITGPMGTEGLGPSRGSPVAMCVGRCGPRPIGSRSRPRRLSRSGDEVAERDRPGQVCRVQPLDREPGPLQLTGDVAIDAAPAGQRRPGRRDAASPLRPAPDRGGMECSANRSRPPGRSSRCTSPRAAPSCRMVHKVQVATTGVDRVVRQRDPSPVETHPGHFQLRRGAGPRRLRPRQVRGLDGEHTAYRRGIVRKIAPRAEAELEDITVGLGAGPRPPGPHDPVGQHDVDDPRHHLLVPPSRHAHAGSQASMQVRLRHAGLSSIQHAARPRGRDTVPRHWASRAASLPGRVLEEDRHGRGPWLLAGDRRQRHQP
jgi:hypothetical protein